MEKSIGSGARAGAAVARTGEAMPSIDPEVRIAAAPAPACEAPTYPFAGPWVGILVTALVIPLGCGRVGYDYVYDPQTDNPCWSRPLGDVCSDPPPPVDRCLSGAQPLIFTDDLDGENDGELFTHFSFTEPSAEPCASLYVGETGYFRLYAAAFAGSGPSQLDETGYVTVHNSCNAEGWPAERNAGDVYVVLDPDNVSEPESVFVGTFLLIAEEQNRICLHHWCREWSQAREAGVELGFVTNDCLDGSSLHFTAAGTAGCADLTTLQRCAWGCDAGACNPDPCGSLSCPTGFCMDGACLEENPCEAVTCSHGCLRGRCLQGSNARGPDRDLDGFSDLADCDDGDALVHPAALEVCGTGIDEDCDGLVDESGCGA